MELGGVVLPAELKRAVFEAAAVFDYKTIARLLLTAHRVYTWLKPFLSHVLVYRGTDTHELFGTHVRHLMLDMRSPVTDITNILAGCSTVHNLACYCAVDPSCLPSLALMRPLRLRIRTVDLFAGGAPRFAHALFARTTHLQLLDYSLLAFDAASWASLGTLPCLTHLAFSAYVAVSARALHELLSESTRLRALVFPTHDVRFVVAVVGDWVAGAWGHADFWARADVIRLRRQDDARVDDTHTRSTQTRPRTRHETRGAATTRLPPVPPPCRRPLKYVVSDASPPARPLARANQRALLEGAPTARRPSYRVPGELHRNATTLASWLANAANGMAAADGDSGPSRHAAVHHQFVVPAAGAAHALGSSLRWSTGPQPGVHAHAYAACAMLD
ncbi:hypothetical protein C8J57DRAFT_1581302 [Mycena rebaudengoi]|nr:hypothetical protein C8J57DRAFT_1581302 [Mycena rebaudengoi]